MQRSHSVRRLRAGAGHGHLAVELVGSGPPILFLHGLTANRSSWSAVARCLPPTRTFVLPDLAGRGASVADPRDRYHLADEVHRVERLVVDLELREPLLVGHSQGSAVALGFVALGRRVRGLVLVNPVTPWTPRPVALGLLRATAARRLAAPLCRRLRRRITRYVLERRVFGNSGRPTPALIARYAAPFADPARAAALMRILEDWKPADAKDLVRRVDVPAAVLAGGLDRRIGTAEALRLAHALGIPLWMDPVSGHALPEENPAWVARAILRVDREAASVEVGNRN